jgi:hypothetical protein
VMLGGRLYDAATLDEVAPVARKRPPYWWQGAAGDTGVSAAALTAGRDDD